MRKRSIQKSKPSIKGHRKANSHQSISKLGINTLTKNKKKIKINLITKSGSKYPLFYPLHAPLWTVKESLLTKIGAANNIVYFNSVDDNRIFDYMFEEGIRLLNTDITISYNYCEPNIVQSGNMNAYEVGECISVGGFSKVYMMRSKKSGKFFVGKFIDKKIAHDKRITNFVFNQKQINQVLNYQFIVKMHNFIETNNFYVLILDYCPSGELFTLMKQHRDMIEEDAKFYFIETVLALRYLHQKGIIYRDIKPENILLDKNGHVKLADFGLAKIIKGKSYSYCGSLQYMAPQIIQGKAHSFAVDYYCLGSLLFELLVGCPPFYSPDYSQSETKMHILHSPVQFPPQELSQQYKDLVCKLLEKDQNKRLGSREGFKQILAHPWIGKLKIEQYEEYRINPPFTISLNKCNFEKQQLPHIQIHEFSQKIRQDLQNFEKFRSLTLKYRQKSAETKQRRLSKSRVCEPKRPSRVKSNQKDKEKSIMRLYNDKSFLEYQINSNKRLNHEKVCRPNQQSLITYEKSKKRLVYKKRVIGKQNQIKEKFSTKGFNLRKSLPFAIEDQHKKLSSL